MVAKRNEHNNDLRSLVTKHFQNGDSQQEMATKTLLPRETVRDIINRYKRTKCIGNLLDRGRKRKTTTTTDRMIRSRAHEIGMFGRVGRRSRMSTR